MGRTKHEQSGTESESGKQKGARADRAESNPPEEWEQQSILRFDVDGRRHRPGSDPWMSCMKAPPGERHEKEQQDIGLSQGEIFYNGW